jgi:DNA ligase-1
LSAWGKARSGRRPGVHHRAVQRFARLIEILDCSTDPVAHRAALVRYFGEAAAADAAWALHLLCGAKLRARVPADGLRDLACRVAGIDGWLFDACHQAAGELAETIALVLPPSGTADGERGLADWVQEVLLPLRGLPPIERDAAVTQAWTQLDTAGRCLFVRLLTGGLRVKPERRCLLDALAEHAGLDARVLAQRLEGWGDARSSPDATRWRALLAPHDAADAGLPFAFVRAAPLPTAPDALGARGDWLLQWLQDGLPAQVIKRQGQVWIWSAEDDLVTASAPEVAAAALGLPDGTVLDGLLRAGRPPCFVAQDLLEDRGSDLRGLPLHERIARLQGLPALQTTAALSAGAELHPTNWLEGDELRRRAREHDALGLLLRPRNARRPGAGPEAAVAWAWKNEPLHIAAVLVYVQADAGGLHHGMCSFAVWNRRPASADEVQAVLDAVARREAPRAGGLELVTIARLQPGLAAMQGMDLDRLVQTTTLHRVGPVRVLRPYRVVELGFDAVQASTRHRCGLVLRGARILQGQSTCTLSSAGLLPQLLALCAPPAAGRQAGSS